MPRRTLPPATGTVKWIVLDGPLGSSGNVIRVLQITVPGQEPQQYAVEEQRDGSYILGTTKHHPEAPENERIEYVEYRVSIDHWYCVKAILTCNCPDALGRYERRFACKHVRGLKAALVALPL